MTSSGDSPTQAEPFAVVARVVKTHGLKGEVSVVSAAEAPFSVLDGVEVWFVPPPTGIRTSRIESSRPGPKGVLVTFSGIRGIDQAHRLVGAEVLVRTEDLPADWTAPEEESDLDGYAVSDEVHGLLGEIVETIVTGANDVWVVEGPLGEVLIPVIDDVVLEIDESERAVRVRLLPGLLPGEGEIA